MARSIKQIKQQMGKLGVQPNLLDKVISYVAPVRAARRLRSRMAMAMVGGYHGGSKSRRSLTDWNTTLSGSADSDLIPNLPSLRDRSRDLIRNSPIASGALK